MKCEEASVWIMKYFDKELNDIEVGQLKQHLKGCMTCNTEFEELNGILGVLEEERGIEPPEGFETLVMGKIKALTVERKKRTDRFFIILYAVSSMILFGMATWLVGYFQEVSFLEVVSKIVMVMNSVIRVFHAISTSEAGGILYGVLITAFALVMGYMGMIIFMDNNVGGASNEADK